MPVHFSVILPLKEKDRCIPGSSENILPMTMILYWNLLYMFHLNLLYSKLMYFLNDTSAHCLDPFAHNTVLCSDWPCLKMSYTVLLGFNYFLVTLQN